VLRSSLRPPPPVNSLASLGLASLVLASLGSVWLRLARLNSAWLGSA